jgi:hypothetical protein
MERVSSTPRSPMASRPLPPFLSGRESESPQYDRCHMGAFARVLRTMLMARATEPTRTRRKTGASWKSSLSVLLIALSLANGRVIANSCKVLPSAGSPDVTCFSCPQMRARE